MRPYPVRMRRGAGRAIGTSRSLRGNPGVITAPQVSQRTPNPSLHDAPGAHDRDWLPAPLRIR